MSTSRSIIVAAAAVATVGVLTACEGTNAPSVAECADPATFARVSNVLERRCGTLDCHGSLARPLKIYGNGGLRIATPEEIGNAVLAQEGGVVPGGNGTTDPERDANYRSLCGLEPELTTLVIRGEALPEDLMVLRKALADPLDFEKHKGGQLFKPGGPGAVCLSCWFRGFPNVLECESAIQDCEDATSGGNL